MWTPIIWLRESRKRLQHSHTEILLLESYIEILLLRWESMLEVMTDIQHRLEQIENGGRKTESDTTPTCVSTESENPQIIDGLTPQQRWRNKNREHYNAKQREYQKAYRARKKEEASQKISQKISQEKQTGEDEDA